MKHLLWILAALLLTSCAAIKRTTTETHEREYNSTQHLDSLFKSTLSRDSIYIHDSIYVREKGDTLYKYVEKIRCKYITRQDTITRYTLKVDTVYRDSGRVEVHERPVYVEKPVKWYNKGFMWLGRMCCIAAILWTLFLYLKRKF